MSTLSWPTTLRAATKPGTHADVGQSSAKRVYDALMAEHGAALGEIDEVTRSTSRAFVDRLLATAEGIESDFPADPRTLDTYLAENNQRTAIAYRGYLDGRRAGAPRRFFRNRSHAFYCLKSLAPTKLVDGAWLYGLLQRWSDRRLRPLVRIYLEELGDGIATRHHVLLYRQLLAMHGSPRWNDLDDAYYIQGALQLALAHHPAELMPEVIGFNLGYEQLPLHLPVTAYELNELDVDPHYFSLHVTIDNAATGHARKALRCALDCLPKATDPAVFYRRMRAGFALNNLGLGMQDVIDSFDLDRELASVLAVKARIGAALHSDYCRIEGRSVFSWLSAPEGMPAFLAALVSAGWIQRGAEPERSRFWHLLNGDLASMFGVFDAYELQLLRDWITQPREGVGHDYVPLHRSSHRLGRAPTHDYASQLAPAASPAEIIAHHLRGLPQDLRNDEDVQFLIERISGVGEVSDAIVALRGFLSPANNPSPAGLLATRICSSLIGQ